MGEIKNNSLYIDIKDDEIIFEEEKDYEEVK